MSEEVNNELTKVTVNLTPKSYDALKLAAYATGDSKTDTINRALQLYLIVVTANPMTKVRFDWTDKIKRTLFVVK